MLEPVDMDCGEGAVQREVQTIERVLQLTKTFSGISLQGPEIGRPTGLALSK